MDPRPRNRILASLPEDELDRLRRDLTEVELRFRQDLVRPNEPIENVLFVERGVMSLVAEDAGEGVVEVATIGHEGMVGLPVFLGSATVPLRSFAQVPGSAHAMTAAALQRAVANGTG